jgi:hypothetical protein
MRLFFSSSSLEMTLGYASAPFAGAPLPAGAPLAGAPFPPAALGSTGTSSFFLILSLTSFTIASSSSESYSPFLSFSCRRNFVRLLLAFSARPGSFASQDALRAFSRSSLSVSFMMARVSLEKIFMYQVRSYVASFSVLHSGHSLRSKVAWSTYWCFPSSSELGSCEGSGRPVFVRNMKWLTVI